MSNDVIFNFFPAIFDAMAVLFSSPPMYYLFGIFFLAFVILIFKGFRKS